MGWPWPGILLGPTNNQMFVTVALETARGGAPRAMKRKSKSSG
jgi:hypothetical protein